MPTCPTHNRDLEPVTGAPVAGGVVLACPVRGCSYSRMPPLKRTDLALKLPRIDPGRQQNQVKVREEELQQAVIQALRVKGYEVLQTTVRYRFSPCQHCGRKTRPQGGYGASPGVPDLLVWVGMAWKGLEIKGTDTPLSDEQKRLAAEGKIVIVRSVTEALEAVGGA